MKNFPSKKKIVLFLFSLLCFSGTLSAQATHTFSIGDNDFLYDNRPFLIKCGEMHFSRIPREYWRHRIQMAKAMGLNTVCAYLFWNTVENVPDKFDWTGMNDAAEFCRIAQSEDMKVILRPGPYSCAEWDFGGFPWWLLKKDNIQLRSRDDRYFMERCRIYLKEVGRVLSPLQITKGGPIVMVQVENEYGSWGKDKEYIKELRDYLLQAGFNVPLFTCDGPSQLVNDVTPEIFSVVNFGSNAASAFVSLRNIRPTGPLMCGEFYPGWFDTWGQNHHYGNTSSTINELSYMLENNGSFSIYMAHGGTTFGMWTGCSSGIAPLTSSYDYDAPIAEGGTVTPKYTAIRELLSGYLDYGKTALPNIPAANKVISIPEFHPTAAVSIISNLGKGIKDCQIRNMEQYNYGYGAINYRTTIPAGNTTYLTATYVRDFAVVYLDGKKIGNIDGARGKSTCELPARTQSATLDIFVLATGRCNYGGNMYDTKKGITQNVVITDGTTTTELTNWTVFPMPLQNNAAPANLTYTTDTVSRPAFYKANFNLTETGDTYLDMTKWGKGLVWVNNHCLGQFWNIGPTQTMYLPGPWLNVGTNEIVIMDVLGPSNNAIKGITTPILDLLQTTLTKHRNPDQTINLTGITPTASGTFINNINLQTVTFPQPVTGRYFCFNAINSFNNDAFTTVAELNLLDDKGNVIPRFGWKIVYADSEELNAEDGNAENILDGQSPTFWHTEWQNTAPIHPHQVVIDLNAQYKIGGFTLLPRQNSANGRTKNYQVFVSATLFPGL